MPNPLTAELQRAISDLYEAIPDRRNGSPIRGLTPEPDEERVLGSVDRHAIPTPVLSHYAFRAVTTWGTADDLRSLVPSLLDGVAQDSIGLNPQLVFNKMQYAGLVWSERERGAIERFLVAWIDAVTHGDGSFGAADAVECAAIAGVPLEPLLAVWETADAIESIKELCECVMSSRLWVFAEHLDDSVFRAWLAGSSARAVLARAAAAYPDHEDAWLWREVAAA